jgi:hypothetical protein
MTRGTNARIAGFTFLFYIAAGVTSLVLGSATRAHGTAATLALFADHVQQVRIGIVLSLVICVTAVTLAVTLYGITRDEDRDLAVLALSFRVGEGMLGAIAPMATLGLLLLATTGADQGTIDGAAAEVLGTFLLRVGGWNATIAAILFAFGSTVFCWLLLRGRMIPVSLAWLGVAASVLLVVGLPLQLAGFVDGPVTQVIWLPMAAFEIPLGFWLLFKGVATPARIYPGAHLG